MRNVIVDFSQFETIDDERTSTAHYGGAIYAREGEEVHTFYPSGTDRSTDIWDDLRSFLVGIGLDFSALETQLQAEADAADVDVEDTEHWFNLYYLENVGTHVLITAEDDGSVLAVSEHITLQERVGRMIKKNLIEMLNGPGTCMAWDDDLEFGFKWNDGKTAVLLEVNGEEVEYRYEIQVVNR